MPSPLRQHGQARSVESMRHQSVWSAQFMDGPLQQSRGYRVTGCRRCAARRPVIGYIWHIGHIGAEQTEWGNTYGQIGPKRGGSVCRITIPCPGLTAPAQINSKLCQQYQWGRSRLTHCTSFPSPDHSLLQIGDAFLLRCQI